MFGKIMSIPDDLILEYYQLLTDLSKKEIEAIGHKLEGGENPRDIKMALAERIATMYHSENEAKKAKEEFINVFAKKELPTDIPEIKITEGNYDLTLLLISLSAVGSNNEARRLIEQGGVKVDEAKITDPKTVIGVRKGMIIQAGKRKFYRIK
jgi:tyrosyl-tRNA synthetase